MSFEKTKKLKIPKLTDSAARPGDPDHFASQWFCFKKGWWVQLNQAGSLDDQTILLQQNESRSMKVFLLIRKFWALTSGPAEPGEEEQRQIAVDLLVDFVAEDAEDDQQDQGE